MRLPSPPIRTKLLGPDGSSRSPAPSSNVGGAAYTLQLYTLANISVSVKPVFEPPDLRIMQQMLLYLPLAAACAALLLQGVCYFFSAIREPTYSSHLEEHNVVVTTNSIRVSKQNHRNARARQAAEARKEQIGKQEKSSKEDVDKSDSVSTRPTHSDESFATSPTSRFGLKPFEQPAKTSLRQSDPAAGVVPKGFGTSDRSKGRSVSWTPQPPSGSDSDPAAGGVRIEGDESARKSARVSPSQGSPSQKSTSTDAYRDPSVVDQFLSRSLSAEAIRTLKDIKVYII
jgi:cytoskeletal protein RodZ